MIILTCAKFRMTPVLVHLLFLREIFTALGEKTKLSDLRSQRPQPPRGGRSEERVEDLPKLETESLCQRQAEEDVYRTLRCTTFGSLHTL